MSYTTSANFGGPRGSVKSLKSLITQRCHGSGRIVRPSDPIIPFSSWRVSRAQSSPVHYSSSLLSATTKQYCVKGVYAFLYFGRAPRSRTRGRILVLRVFERSFECVRFCMRSLQPWVVFG